MGWEWGDGVTVIFITTKAVIFITTDVVVA
jgi:hypothetical protein